MKYTERAGGLLRLIDDYDKEQIRLIEKLEIENDTLRKENSELRRQVASNDIKPTVELTDLKPEPEPKFGWCGCGNPGIEPHTCPFNDENHPDNESLCNCCNECAYHCYMEA